MPRIPMKAVFFDIDDTLYSTTRFAERARMNAVRAMIRAGLRIAEAEALAELDEVIAEFSSNYEHHYEKLLLRLPEEAQGLNPAILVAAAVVAYHETKSKELAPFPDVAAAFPRLAKAGLTLGIITSGLTVKQAEKLVRLGLLPHLAPNGIFISEQLGISKPNPKLWQWACRAMKLRPSDCAYVGDHPVHDVEPVKKLGMKAILNRRGVGKYEGVPARVAPDHEIRSFDGLIAILKKDYGVRVPE